MSKAENPLALAAGLTAKANQLCIGLEDGVADIFDLVMPTTAELLRWWFLADRRPASAVPWDTASHNFCGTS